MTLTAPSAAGGLYSDYFSENYVTARSRIEEAAATDPNILSERLLIAAKGYNEEPLSVNMIWIGPRDAPNIMIHISGTHGVEGFAGSAIQLSLLQNPIQLPPNTSMIIIHGLNPYGMAHFRRVTENNVDLNRNFPIERITPPVYQQIDDLVNPKEYSYFDFFSLRLLWRSIWGDGLKATINALANGQYDFEEGLIFGGKDIEEAPRHVFEWFENNFSGKTEDVRIVVMDVHTGLGSYAEDTLLTVEPPTENMISIFGTRINAQAQEHTTGYRPTGMFIEALRDLICRVTHCTRDKITLLGQEFGTVSFYKVVNALRDENTVHHTAKRDGIVLDPSSPVRQELLRAFYPSDHRWKHLVVQRGRELVEQAQRLFTPSGAASSSSHS